jgi:hypothetical protein
MEERTIGWLNEEFLEHWRTINRFKYLAKLKSDYLTDTELVNLYYHELDFLRNCIQYWQIDESREWDVSEYTGRVYYRENVYGESRHDGDDSVGEGDKEDKSSRRSGNTPGQRG